MSPNCPACEEDFNGPRSHNVLCDQCRKYFHIDCAGVPSELRKPLRSVAGLLWKCEDCRYNPIIIADLENSIKQKFEECLNSFRSEFENKFSLLKTEFSSLSEHIIKEHLAPITNDLKSLKPAGSNQPSFANVLSRPEAKCIVKPKAQNQQISVTKAEILDKINPLDSGITINEVRGSKGGGLIIGCNSKPDCEKFTELASKTLASTYDIHPLKLWRPRINVVGMSAKLEGDALLKCIKSQNKHLFSEEAELNVVEISHLKKNSAVYQAKIELDITSYKTLLDARHMLVGLDACSIYDAVSLTRCFKCNEFNHSSKHCKKTSFVCPICSGNHDLKTCNVKSADLHKCSNCVSLANRSGENINCQHAAWDLGKCLSYKKAVAKFKKDLFGIENE